MRQVYIPYLILICIGRTCLADPDSDNEKEAAKYLSELEAPFSAISNIAALANWDYVTNVTKATEKRSVEESTKLLKFLANIQKDILKKFPNWRKYKDATTRRKMKEFHISGPGTMPDKEVAAMMKHQSEMEAEYATAEVCEFENPSNCTLRLNPELQSILQTEKDPKLLAYYWTAWHDKMSERISPKRFQTFLNYQLTVAKANEFKDMSEMWMVPYDDGDPDYTASGFKQEMLDLWEEIRPMFNKIHAYVRMKLRKRPEYKDLFGECGYIPIYLTGNMWAQDWSHLDPITKPFPDAPSLDATEAMIKKNYTVEKMFKISEEFFTSLGLPPMTPTFWEKSLFVRPSDGREVVCHASAHDFGLGKGNEDFRIKQCTEVNQKDFITVHHEMGHIAYYYQYRDQEKVFRGGANPGFHEAIGDSLALAVLTPQHLQCKLELDLGLEPSICDDIPQGQKNAPVSETDINFLYITALSTLVTYPFAISVDNWRWGVFNGTFGPDQYNSKWWEIRMKNQGIKPTTDRNSPKLFDPAAKYHIVADTEYLRYFISHVLQYQFYEAMCIAAGQFNLNKDNTRPLYQCDFAGSKKAGRLLGDMMKLGSSKGWPAALEAITGSRKMSIEPLKRYFKPMLDHIGKELEKNGEVPGFGKEGCKENLPPFN